jgi:hypothetical protein
VAAEDLPPLPVLDFGPPRGPQSVYVALRRGDKWRLGALDAAGNFIPDYRFGPYRADPWGYSAMPSFQWLNMLGEKSYLATYEHRSGCLIKGTLIPAGTFVPDLGSRVIDLKTHHRDPDRPLFEIYNMPDFRRYDMLLRQAREAKVAGKANPANPLWRPEPIAPVPPSAGTPAAYEFHPYSRVPEPPWFAHVQGKRMELGHLDDAGDFVPEYNLPPFPLVQPWRVVYSGLTGAPNLSYYNLPKGGEKEDVYEYRSGRLLKGTLLKSGTFVPELGSEVLDFKDYQPGPNARRIYNLPGQLRKSR